MNFDGRYHHAYVQLINGGTGGYFASCPTCGPDPFPDRETKAEAERDADEHRREHTA